MLLRSVILVILNPGISVRALNLLKWKDGSGHEQTFRLVDRVSSKWMEFGRLLGLHANQLDGWKMESLGTVATCWNKVMAFWLEEGGGGGGAQDYPATWEGLYSLLEDLNLREIAKELEMKVALSQCAV